MNQEYERIQDLIKKAESAAVSGENCRYRLGFHIMPPTGWLNDPNGLCQLGDTYHLFFQYSPLDARGGMKVWGHYMTKDFCHITYAGAPFVPDASFDKDGVYSGSTYVDDNGMHIFYTGNAKLSGEHDFTTSGRRADTVLVESRDGMHFSPKQVVINTDDYPEHYSCHIRDPKVWQENGMYYMVLGGRTREDEGRILLYTSEDLLNWSLLKELTAKEHFAYMWECPDLFCLDDKYILSFSPQGLEKREFMYQNIYQSGYFVSDYNPVTEDVVFDGSRFYEWDMGFDFYAPQTFLDAKGRRILIGWAGVPDAEYFNQEVEAENWQHCFTVPRRLAVRTDEHTGITKVYQQPVSEITALRGEKQICSGNAVMELDSEYWDIECNELPEKFAITIADGVKFSYNGSYITLTLTEEAGCGRDIRKCLVSRVHSVRILVDSSILEYYINDGEVVFTTRYYKGQKGTKLTFECGNADIAVYPMGQITVDAL